MTKGLVIVCRIHFSIHPSPLLTMGILLPTMSCTSSRVIVSLPLLHLLGTCTLSLEDDLCKDHSNFLSPQINYLAPRASLSHLSTPGQMQYNFLNKILKIVIQSFCQLPYSIIQDTVYLTPEVNSALIRF